MAPRRFGRGTLPSRESVLALIISVRDNAWVPPGTLNCANTGRDLTRRAGPNAVWQQNVDLDPFPYESMPHAVSGHTFQLIPKGLE
jgi:hypothetical protein